MNTPQVHVSRRGSVHVTSGVNQHQLHIHGREQSHFDSHQDEQIHRSQPMDPSSRSPRSRMRRSEMDTKHGEMQGDQYLTTTSTRRNISDSPRSRRSESPQSRARSESPSRSHRHPSDFQSPSLGGNSQNHDHHDQHDQHDQHNDELLDSRELRIRIPASAVRTGQVGSPSKSIVQLYELEFTRMKERCARAESALAQSYRSLDKLNDLIVETDSSTQLASNTSVNTLLEFFQKVCCLFFFSVFFAVRESSHE